MLTHHLTFDPAAWDFSTRFARAPAATRARRGSMSARCSKVRKSSLLESDLHEANVAAHLFLAGELHGGKRRLCAEGREVGHAVHVLGTAK